MTGDSEAKRGEAMPPEADEDSVVTPFESAARLTGQRFGQRRERRATDLALSDWARHVGDTLPSFAELRDTFDDAEAWRHRFLLKRDAIPSRSVFIMCGEAVRDWTVLPPVSRTLSEAVPAEMREVVCALCEAVSQTSEPQVADGHYCDANGAQVHYRCVFLPMRGAESELDYIMGAFSAKRTVAMATN